MPHTADLVKFIAEDFFDKEGFNLIDYHGEAVWKKGIGMVTAPQFIKLSYQNRDGFIWKLGLSSLFFPAFIAEKWGWMDSGDLQSKTLCAGK